MEQQVTNRLIDSAVDKTMNAVIEGMMQKSINVVRHSMHEQVIANQAINKVMDRILSDFILVFEIDTMIKTAENIVSQKLIGKLVNEFIGEIIG